MGLYLNLEISNAMVEHYFHSEITSLYPAIPTDIDYRVRNNVKIV